MYKICSTVVIKSRPDANYINTPDLIEMEALLRQRPDTLLGFCKGGANFPHRIADSAFVSSLKVFQMLDDFDYVNQPAVVVKSRHEPEVNLAEILKALKLAVVLEVVGVQFCRVAYVKIEPAPVPYGMGVGMGNCLQHSKWDRDRDNKPNGKVFSLGEHLALARSDSRWATVRLG